MLEEKGRDGAAAATTANAAAACCAVLCFAAGACEGYDVMPMTDGHGDTTPPPQPTEEAGGWMLCQQDKARGGEVEKVRRLTYAHGWQCGHKTNHHGDCI